MKPRISNRPSHWFQKAGNTFPKARNLSTKEEEEDIKTSVGILKHMNLMIFFSPTSLAGEEEVVYKRKEENEGKREVFICGSGCISHVVCGCSGWLW